MTIVCGDLHGKVDIAKELLQDPSQDLIFIGDLLDSYTATTDKQLDLLVMVLDACKERDNVCCIMGNHELSYLYPIMRCSGYSHRLSISIYPYKQDMKLLFQDYIVSDGFLLTHAGVSLTWLPQDLQDSPSLDSVEKFLSTVSKDKLFEIGRSRGGANDCGGPFWCDYWDEFMDIDGIKQVFGHSASRPLGTTRGIFTSDMENFNIDCLDNAKEVLEINNGNAKIVRL
jgi:hypothetical protein